MRGYVSNMADYIPRSITNRVLERLKQFPAVVILGPRQCGKTSLAGAIVGERQDAVYLDLEKRSDLNKLRDPETFFSLNSDKLICLDEIQRVPELFAVMRSHIDKQQRPAQFLILGSASRDLIRQSSESLAGRISHLELTPFLFEEVSQELPGDPLRELWLRGGFPRSVLANNAPASFVWLEEFVRTFLERDIPALGLRLNIDAVSRLWQMCAHLHGSLLNASALGSSIGVSHHTIRSYLEILEKTFMLRILCPLEANLKKRLVKTPKIYLRDTGILHVLLDIQNHNDLLGHPVYGASWEGLVIEHVLATLPGVRPSFFRSRSGAEIDLIIEKGRHCIAIECKASSAPRGERGFWTALDDLCIKEAYIVAPVNTAYPIERGVFVTPMDKLLVHLKKSLAL